MACNIQGSLNSTFVVADEQPDELLGISERFPLELHTCVFGDTLRTAHTLDFILREPNVGNKSLA